LTSSSDPPPVDALIEALELQVGVGRQVLPSQLSCTTPCGDWTVREVMNHSVGVTMKFTDFAAGRTNRPRAPEGDLLGADHDAAIRRAAAAAGTAWANADMNRMCHLPFGSFSAIEAVGINLFDVLAHTWDVATGIDILVGGPDTLWQAALNAATRVVGPARDTVHYAPELLPPDTASARTRFLGFLGRHDAEDP
jgi:uncharacterized protein (TIGR03086 family)